MTARSMSRRGLLGVLATILLIGGLALAVVGLASAFADEVGYPWDTSTRAGKDRPVTVTIEHEDGRVETFEADSPEAANQLIEQRHAELRTEYSLDRRATIGKVELFGGLVLAAVGIGLLVWAAAFGRPRRSAAT